MYTRHTRTVSKYEFNQSDLEFRPRSIHLPTVLQDLPPQYLQQIYIMRIYTYTIVRVAYYIRLHIKYYTCTIPFTLSVRRLDRLDCNKIF